MLFAQGAASAAPTLQDDTETLLDEFDQLGVLRVKSPDGAGTYTFVKDKTNIKGMPLTLYWDGEKHGTTVHYGYSGHEAHPVYGGEVAFSVKTDGPWSDATPSDQKAIVATVLQFIESGRKVYMNNCGLTIAVDAGIV